MIDRLRQAIADAGAEAGPEELADILWLARCMAAARRTPADDDRPGRAQAPEGGSGADRPDSVRERPPAGPSATRPRAPGPPLPKLRTGSGTGDLLFPATEPSTERRTEPSTEPSGAPAAGPRSPGPPPESGRRRGVPVRVGRASSLDDPLAVMRALRPLGRRRLPGNRPELDEELTVSAGLVPHLLLPVMRPARERWLDLTLVVDTDPSMLLWHDLVAELRALLTQTGLFRTVRVWFLRASGGGRPDARITVSATPDGEPRSPREVGTGGRHGLILLVSDAVSDVWQWPELRAAVGQWCAHSAVALLHLLPERLWGRSAVRPEYRLMRATAPAAPNVSWSLAVPSGDRAGRPTRPPAGPTAALPVVDTSPHSLSVLASLASGSGRWHGLPCLPLDADRAPGEVPGEPQRGPSVTGPRDAGPGDGGDVDRAALRAVRRFEESASPVARELAGYLSAVPLTLPVMNLVRRAMLPGSDHGHLAEVALGGLLEPWEAYHRADPAYVELRFLPGVRDALIGGRLRREITAVRELVREEVSAYLDQRRAAGDFPAIRHTPDGAGTRAIAPETLAFAFARNYAPPSGRSAELSAAIDRAFQDPDVRIDAVIGGATTLLAALTHSLLGKYAAEGVAWPASVRVRVLSMGDDGDSRDIEMLRHLLEDIVGDEHSAVTFEVRTSTSQPATELYLINDRTVFTSYFDLPGETLGALHRLPDDGLEETRDWFEGWWELYGSR